MRKNLVAIFIVLLILGLGTYEHFYLDKTFTELDEKTCIITEDIENKNYEKALNEIEQLEVWWEEKHGVIEIFSYNADAKYIKIYLSEMEGGLNANSNEFALARAYALKTVIKELKDNTEFLIVNIF